MIFTYGLVLWVLHNWEELSCGVWPDPDSSETASRRRQVASHAPFENPCALAGEIAGRVRICGQDGMIVEERFGLSRGEKTVPEDIARYRHMDLRDIKGRISKVIWFCTDEEWGKGLKYGAWKKETHGNRKQRQSATTGVQKT